MITRSKPTFSQEFLSLSIRGKIHDLHIVQSGIVLPEHLELFEKGIAKKLDFSYSGAQSASIAKALSSGKIELGAIHTYIEPFARYIIRPSK